MRYNYLTINELATEFSLKGCQCPDCPNRGLAANVYSATAWDTKGNTFEIRACVECALAEVNGDTLDTDDQVA